MSGKRTLCPGECKAVGRGGDGGGRAGLVAGRAVGGRRSPREEPPSARCLLLVSECRIVPRDRSLCLLY